MLKVNFKEANLKASFKEALLIVQELTTPMRRKIFKYGRRPACCSRELFSKLNLKKGSL